MRQLLLLMVFIFFGILLQAQIISHIPDQTFIGNKEFKEMGAELVSQGDVNGDGYNDILSYADDNHSSGHYTVEIYLGKSYGFDTIPFWSKDFGDLSVSAFDITGDYNNDGYDDIICANYNYLNKGIVYCFNGNPTSISLTASWSYSPVQLNSWFGRTTCNAGDVNNDGYDDLLVGATGYSNGQPGEGAVFLFPGGPAGPALSYTWLEDNNKSGSGFGSALMRLSDINGDNYDDVAISAAYYPFSGPYSGGRVYVYYGKATGLSASPVWTYSGNVVDEYAGMSLGSGDFNNDGNPDLVSFGVYLKFFYGDGVSYPLVPDYILPVIPPLTKQYLLSTGDVNGDGYDDLFIPGIGAGYLGCYEYSYFDRPGCVIMQGTENGIFPYPTFSTDLSFDECAVIMTGTFLGDLNGDNKDEFVTSDIIFDDGSLNEPGVLYLYYGGDLEEPLAADWIYEAQTTSYTVKLGSVSEVEGDINGDGIEDLIIGGNYAYKASIYLGDTGELSNINDGYVNPLMNINDIDCSGDLNGDGFDDCISGCYTCSTVSGVSVEDGIAVTFNGYEEGLTEATTWDFLSDNDGAQLGKSVAIIGDVNGDGYDDAAIGVPNYDLGAIDEGVVYIFLGSSTGLNFFPDYTIEADQAYAHFGSDVKGAGDVNGDGYDDILIGAPDYDVSCTDDGVAMLFLGDPYEITYYPNWVHIGSGCGDKAGYSVAGAGDINNDGYDDILIGAPFANDTYSSSGSVYMYLGGPEGPSYTPDWQASGESTGDNLGYHVSGAGDYNGDGYNDVLAGSYTYNYGSDPQGLIFLYTGNPFGLSNEHYKRIYKGTAYTNFAKYFTGGGDFNGDGYDDFAVGEEGYSGVDENDGRLYLFLGKPTECGVVSGASVSAITSSGASVSWLETDTATAYYFQWKKTGTSIWNSEVLYSNMKTFSGLSECTGYTYRIQKICTSGAADFTPDMTFTTNCLPLCTSAPTGLSATVTSSSSASLSWAATPGAVKYKVYYRPAGGGAWSIKNAVTNSCNLTGLTHGAIYQYKVKAICAGGLSSPFSMTKTFTTPLKLNDQNSTTVNIYPNPTRGKITIVTSMDAAQADIYTISVRNILGELIQEINASAPLNELDISGNAAGVYFVSVQNNAGTNNTFSIILNK